MQASKEGTRDVQSGDKKSRVTARAFPTNANLTPTSTTHDTTMRRSSGQESSGNRKPNGELSESARASIITKRNNGALLRELAEEFGVNRSTIVSTISRWKSHQTTSSLPRSGRPPITTVREQRNLQRIARREPKIEYRQLRKDAGLEDPSPRRKAPPSIATLRRIKKSRPYKPQIQAKAKAT